MLSLPAKPWKKIKLDDQGAGRYGITILSPLADREAFEDFSEELRACLGAEDTLGDPHWETRRVTLHTADLLPFKRKLIYANIIIDSE